MRPQSLPRLIVAQKSDSSIGQMSDSPYSAVSAHSRNSSGASANSSPLTQTFSFHEHHRHSNSSTSSLGTTPPKYEPSVESLHRISRTTLDDLVEDPHEREDAFDLCDVPLDPNNCRCALDRADSYNFHYPSELDVCHRHRQCQSASALERPSLDYSLADGFSDMNSDNETPLSPLSVPKRRDSTESPVSVFASRIGSRLPSFSKHRERTASSPVVSKRRSIKSAPTSRAPSRASSFRMPSHQKPAPTANESQSELPLPHSPVSSPTEVDLPPSPAKPLEIQIPRPEEPIDRKALASTPLLPMPLDGPSSSEEDLVQSPLQSPTIIPSSRFSAVASPSLSPALTDFALPTLSTQCSVTSLGTTGSNHTLSTTDIPSMSINGPQDKWAKKLGHANFNVYPEPYLPDIYNMTACKRLLEDWESARKQFMNQAARTSEHYGPTSQVFKFTEQKWAEIDMQWKRNHEFVVMRTAENGESPVYQPLAEPTPLTKLPFLSDPLNSGKFPKLEDSDIVGPMVQYAKITRKTSKKTAFLKFFNDLRYPSNTLSRPPAGLGR